LELDCEAPDITAGASRLAQHPDLPEDARRDLLGGVFLPRCGAKFLRRTRLCKVEDALFHLCLDEGQLVNGERSQPLCEIELELAEGDAAVLEQTAQRLMDAYHLPLCTKSKQQRALELDEVTV
jgi:inorganic triphosphatase YgiF